VILTDATTGINELSNNALFISPSPASTSIYVHAMNLNSNSMVSIYSITGELILNEKLNANNQINISNLDKGVYLVQVTIEETKEELTKLAIFNSDSLANAPEDIFIFIKKSNMGPVV